MPNDNLSKPEVFSEVACKDALRSSIELVSCKVESPENLKPASTKVLACV